MGRNRGGKAVAALVLLASATAAACSGDDDDGVSANTEATTPPIALPGDEWVVHKPDDHDIVPSLLEDAREYAFADGMNTQGVVVVHEGAIVGEWYADAGGADAWAASWSMAKSFTSALIGIAIEDGLIPSVAEPMTTYFPDWKGTDKEDITIKDVLQMSSGLDWLEEYDPAAIDRSDIIQMVVFQKNQLKYASERPAEHEPGTHWSYSSGDTMLLSGVLEQATGGRADEYAERVLFEPIQMEKVEWWRDAQDHTLTYCCLDTTSRGFARFGLLYLEQGKWGDEQIVPTDWVEESLSPAPTAEEDHYGYQWWLDDMEGIPEDTFMANGHDGQFIYVVPSLDLVVVRNGTYVKDRGEPVATPSLFERYPSDGLVEGKGTSPPKDWDHVEFLGPIVEALE